MNHSIFFLLFLFLSLVQSKNKVPSQNTTQ